MEGRLGTLQGRVVCGGEARYPSRQGGVEGRLGTLQGRVVCGGEARYPSRQGGVWRGG